MRWLYDDSDFNCTIQELKVPRCGRRLCAYLDFNCTIQELKAAPDGGVEYDATNFNCTIQELKDEEQGREQSIEEEFQLHHTGIKSAEVFGFAYGELISIAPYRN